MSLMSLYPSKTHNLSNVCAFKMHKLLSNSVTKFKNLNIRNLVAERSYKNGLSCCGIHTVSNSNAKKQSRKDGLDTSNKVVNFDEIVATRRAQAQKSIAVQVNSEKSFAELHQYCSQYGTIIGAHHYALTDAQFILLEYSNELEAKQALEHSTFNDPGGVWVHSQFLWFRAAGNVAVAPNSSSKVTDKLMATDGCRSIEYDKINDVMLGAETVSDQIQILYKATTLNDVGIRLRFLAARQIENSVSGIFPEAEASIFGSTVNGYGKLGSDLDLILQLNSNNSELDTTKRLVFHTKDGLMNARSQVQRNLENLSNTMQLFLPGVSRVRRILQARVPIIRYYHDHLGLEVDLSMNNMSGVYMSELLYMFTQIDERVAPLVSSIRRWAQTNGVTNTSPGVWISNFSLTCLVIFYLQQLMKPVLPSINTLVAQARPQDKRLVEEGVQCTFLRDLNLLNFKKENTDSLDRLLVGFFEFYSQMNFKERAISLNDAKLHPKPDHSAIYIINPLEPTLNVTKNISFQESERFSFEVRNAAWLLESTGTDATKSDNSHWGLLNLIRSTKKPIIQPTMFFKSRMMEVNDIFDDKAEKPTTIQTNQNIKFKDSSVKNVVNNIKKQRRNELTALKSAVRKR